MIMMNMLAALKPFKTIKFNGKEYPEFQANGNAARFIMPFAKEVCKFFPPTHVNPPLLCQIVHLRFLSYWLRYNPPPIAGIYVSL